MELATPVIVGKGEGVLIRDDGTWLIRIDPHEAIVFDLQEPPPGVYRSVEGWGYIRQDDGTHLFVPGTIREVQP